MSIIISTRAVELLEIKAIKLQETSEMTIEEARNEIAKTVQCASWREVVEANGRIKASEKALEKGFVVAFEFSDVYCNLDNETFIYDSYIEMLTEKQRIEFIGNSIDPDDDEGRLFKDTLSTDELFDYVVNELSLTFFRLSENKNELTTKQVLRKAYEEFCAIPWYVWTDGVMQDADERFHECANDDLY